MRCHSRSRTRCDGTPCYSHNEHRSHCVLAGDTRLPRASVALPMLSAHKPHWCHRRQAEHAAVRGSRQTCAATTWNRTRPANPRRHRCDCWTRGPTAEAPTPSGSMHRDAPAVKARERPRQPLRESLKDMHPTGTWPALSRFCEGGRKKSCFFALRVSTR